MPFTKENAVALGSLGGRPVEWTEDRTKAMAVDMATYFEDETKHHIVQFLAEYGIHWEILHRLINKYPWFSEFYKRMKTLCEARLLNEGENEESKPKSTFKMFLMKCIHKYQEVSKVEHTHTIELGDKMKEIWDSRLSQISHVDNGESTDLLQDVEFKEVK